MVPVHSIIYVASAEDKAPALIRFLRFLPLAWFVLEVIVLVEVGEAIGALAVVGLLLLAGLAGGLLLRHVGTSMVTSLLMQNVDGRTAIERLRSAGWQVAAGLLLILPGFASDVVALLLFLPPVRRWISRMLPTASHGRRGSAVIEGEFHDVTPDGDDRTTPRFPRPDEPAGTEEEPSAAAPDGPPTRPPGPHGNPWSGRGDA